MTNGKGDAARPKSVTEQEYAERWARTFGVYTRINDSAGILHFPPTKEPDERPADRPNPE